MSENDLGMRALEAFHVARGEGGSDYDAIRAAVVAALDLADTKFMELVATYTAGRTPDESRRGAVALITAIHSNVSKQTDCTGSGK